MNLADKIGAFEILRQYAFRMYITSTGTSGLVNSEHFELAIKDGFLPNRTTEEVEIDVDNEKIYYAGKNTWENGSVVARDFVDANVCKFLDDWHDAVFNPATGASGYKTEYAGEAIIQQYDPAGQIIREWKVINIWPTNVDHGAVTKTSAEGVEINVTFRYDRCVKTIS